MPPGRQLDQRNRRRGRLRLYESGGWSRAPASADFLRAQSPLLFLGDSLVRGLFLTLIAALVVITFVPSLSLWLPGVFG